MTFDLVEARPGVGEHSFRLSVDGHSVPGAFWSPLEGAGPRAAVLLGHGRTAHKRSQYLVALAHDLVARGLAVVALDAPGHGERRRTDVGSEVQWPRPEADQAVQEWCACIDLLGDDGVIDVTTLGYWGISMGTSLGISLLAAEPRVRAAVLGLMHPNWPAPPGDRLRADARQVTCPLMFLVNWDDRRAPRAQAFELYELLGSKDKRLHAYPGDHGELPDEAMTASIDFLFGRLTSGPTVQA
jgi:dienelactone hydrolase